MRSYSSIVQWDFDADQWPLYLALPEPGPWLSHAEYKAHLTQQVNDFRRNTPSDHHCIVGRYRWTVAEMLWQLRYRYDHIVPPRTDFASRLSVLTPDESVLETSVTTIDGITIQYYRHRMNVDDEFAILNLPDYLIGLPSGVRIIHGVNGDPLQGSHAKPQPEPPCPGSYLAWVPDRGIRRKAWCVNINGVDLFELARKIGDPLIINKDGTITVYDSWME